MMASIARKETLALLRDGRLWSLGLTLALLFIAMLFTAVDRRDKAEQERSAVEHAVRDQWDHQGDKNPHRAAHFGLYAFKPRSALSSVEPGVDAQTGQALWLEPHKRNMAMFTPAADAAPALGLGAFTPAFVLLALVPLLIAVLGHSTVTQERELGTLRMLHACGARATPLLLGKWLGLCAGLALVLAPALIVGAWGMMADPRGMAAAASLGAALLPYYATWAAGTVLVSAFCTSSRAALLVMIAFWIAAVFIVPRLAASWVEHIAPSRRANNSGRESTTVSRRVCPETAQPQRGSGFRCTPAGRIPGGPPRRPAVWRERQTAPVPRCVFEQGPRAAV